MSNLNYLHQRIQQLEEIINKMHKKTESLESIISELKKEIDQLKNTPHTSIEYKFDQLKIETLEGTLNIGLSPGGNGLENIEQFGVNGKDLNVNQETDAQEDNAFSKEVYEWINQGVDHYLNHDIFSDIQKTENRVQFNLSDSQKKLVVDDIKKQMSMRLPHYVMAVNPQHVRSEPHKEADRVMEQIKKDILAGLEIYMNNVRGKSQEGGQ